MFGFIGPFDPPPSQVAAEGLTWRIPPFGHPPPASSYSAPAAMYVQLSEVPTTERFSQKSSWVPPFVDSTIAASGSGELVRDVLMYTGLYVFTPGSNVLFRRIISLRNTPGVNSLMFWKVATTIHSHANSGG